MPNAKRTQARHSALFKILIGCVVAFGCGSPVIAQVAIRGDLVYTMAGEPIKDGVVLVADGKIAAIGPADQVDIPADSRIMFAAVVTPGLIDAHSTAGLTGIYNQRHDQDHLDKSSAIQPELRAIDAVNVREDLLEYLRGYGVTTLHTGHSSGALIPGQTMIIKNVGGSVEEARLVETAAILATLGPGSTRSEGSPGTRGKQMSMLRQELIKAREYLTKREAAAEADMEPAAGDADNDADNDADKPDKEPTPRDLRLEALGSVLRGELPLMVTANKAQDIATALRLKEEFGIRLWLDGAAESYLLIDSILAAQVPVFLHPTMIRAAGEYENLSFETAGKLAAAGIPVLMQSGFEGYVPKTRVVLFEAGIAAANGMTAQQALAMITVDAAKVLGIVDRVGTLEVGKDADLALYDGDPFEYTTHCIGVLINGQIVSDEPK